MARMCARENCGKRLLTKHGDADYRRHFCGSQCKKADKREAMQARRAKLKIDKCPTCGRKPDYIGAVPRHNVPTSSNLQEKKAE